MLLLINSILLKISIHVSRYSLNHWFKVFITEGRLGEAKFSLEQPTLSTPCMFVVSLVSVQNKPYKLLLFLV
jgi:hypothetical protein